MPSLDADLFLTSRQHKLLDFIEKFRKANENSPTQREMAEGLGNQALRPVQEILDVLQRKKIITRKPGSSRGIHIRYPNWRTLPIRDRQLRSKAAV